MRLIRGLYSFFSLLRIRIIGRLNPVKSFQLLDIRNSVEQSTPGKLLDIGCGSGYLSLQVAKASASVTGVDIKENRHWKSINAEQGNVHCLSFDDFEHMHAETKYDVILLSEVISETSSPEVLLDYYDLWLKSAYKIVVVTSFGRPHIGNLIDKFDRRGEGKLLLYQQQLYKAFSVNAMKMHSKELIIQALADKGFVLSAERNSLSRSSAFFFELFQYLMVKMSLKPYGMHFALAIPFMWVTQIFGRKKSDNYSIMEFVARGSTLDS